MTMSSPAAGAVYALARTPAAAARYDLTPRATVVCAVLSLAAVTGLDLIDGRLGVAFSVGFVLIVLSAAMAVQERGFFTVGVMPPVLLVGALLVITWINPTAIEIPKLPETAGLFGRTLTATIAHGVPLLIGHALALAVIVARILNPRR